MDTPFEFVGEELYWRLRTLSCELLIGWRNKTFLFYLHWVNIWQKYDSKSTNGIFWGESISFTNWRLHYGWSKVLSCNIQANLRLVQREHLIFTKGCWCLLIILPWWIERAITKSKKESIYGQKDKIRHLRKVFQVIFFKDCEWYSILQSVCLLSHP